MIFKFLNKKNVREDSLEHFDPVAETKNWYSDKYEAIILQRNILFLIILLSISAIFAGSFVINSLANKKTIEPFVIEIDDKTGITTVVNPLTRQDLTTDNALNNYFIIKFLRARETYSRFEFDFNNNIVRLLSSPQVYREYRQVLKDSLLNPLVLYGDNNSTNLKIRSLIFMEVGRLAQVRFTVTENEGTKSVRNKIANIEFTYNQMEMTEDERQINPLGFQIINYRVTDETL
ncbi:MAG: virB8 family protein [Alphaproteobacteria bacterium]